MSEDKGIPIFESIQNSFTSNDAELQERVVEQSMQFYLSTKDQTHLFCSSETSASILSFLIVVVSGFDVDFPEEQFMPIRNCISSCTDCLIAYHLARAEVRKNFIMWKKVPYKSVQLTMEKPAIWEANYLFKNITEAIEKKVDNSSMKDLIVKLLAECLLNPKILKLNPKLKIYFDSCTSHLHLSHQLLLKKIKIYPGIIYLLFEGNEEQRNWALSTFPYKEENDSDIKGMDNYFSTEDFNALFSEEYEKHFFNIQRPDFYSDDKAIEFWTNIIPLIRFSSIDAIKKYIIEPYSCGSYREDTKIRIIPLMNIFINHIFSYRDTPLPFLLRFLSVALSKFTKSIFEYIEPHNYMSFFDMSFNNPSYKKYLTTLNPESFPDSKLELDSSRTPYFVDLIKWMQLCLNFLNEPNSCQFSIAMFGFLADYVKHPICGNFIGTYIMETMATQLTLKNRIESEKTNIELTYKTSARDLVNKRSIVLFDATTSAFLKSKALKLIQKCLCFDIDNYAYHSYKLNHNQNTITPEFNNILWNLLQSKISSNSSELIAAVLSSFKHMYKIFPIDLQYKKIEISNESKMSEETLKAYLISSNTHNIVIEQFTVAVQNIFNKLSEYLNIDEMKQILKSEDCSRGFWTCILSPIDKIYESSIACLYEAFDVDDRLQAFKSCLKIDFLGTLNAFTSSLAHFTSLELFGSTRKMVKLLFDFINALFNPVNGVIVTIDFKMDILKSSIIKCWGVVWKFLGMVFKNIFHWSISYEKLKSTLTRDKSEQITTDLLNFTRDVLDLSHLVLNGHKIIISLVYSENYDEQERNIIKEVLLSPIIRTLGDLFKWLRLSDSALLIRCVDLVKKILDLSYKVTEISDDLLSILIKLCLRAKKFNNKMTTEQTGELLLRARKINHHLVETILASVEAEKKKKQVLLSTPTISLSNSKYNYEYQSRHADNHSTKPNQQTLSNYLKPYSKSLTPSFDPPKRLSKLELAQLKLKEKRNAPSSEPAPARPSGFNKKKLAAVDSDSESDASDVDGANGLFTKEQVVAKMKKTKATLQSLQGSRFASPSLDSNKDKNTEEIQRKKAEELMRLRLNVDMTPLYKTILTWAYNNDKELPSDYDSANYKPVQNKFDSVSEYQKTFEPLLLLECWQSIQRSKQIGSEMPFRLTVGSRSATDCFFDIYASLKKQVINDLRLFGDNDLLVLMLVDNLPDEDDGVGIPKRLLKNCQINCFAKVREIKNTAGKLADVTLRVSTENNNLVHKITSGMELVGLKVITMTTLEREFSSLRGLQYYDLNREIITAAPAPLRKFDSGKIQDIKTVYDVNDSQANAIAGTVEGEGFSLIQGPPGTGKTKTILGVVGYFLTQDMKLEHNIPVLETRSSKILASNQNKKKILICAPSNAAVDELVLRIRKGIKNSKGAVYKPDVVRLGKSDAINEQVKDLTLEEQVDAQLSKIKNNDDSSIREEHRKCIIERDELRKKLETGNISDTEVSKLEIRLQEVMTKRRELGKRLDESREQRAVTYRNREIERRNLQYKILNNAQVVCSTLSGSAHDVLAGMSMKFDTVVIDEAAQCIELSAIIPLRYGCTKCIMVGDPNQLPPTVLSQKAASFNYEQSLFVRMQNNHKDSVYLLDVQYRMNPEISKFPSKEFYDSKLKDGPNMAAITAREWHDLKYYGPYRFFNIKGEQRQNDRTKSLSNTIECKVILEIVEDLYRKFPKIDWANRIGIISPYKEQIRLLKKTFVDKYGSLILKQIDFNTVDGFQGQEKDIILFSCVRAETHSGIGFVADIRRMNVALTRARASLWVVGFVDALISNKTWRDLFHDAKDRNLVTEARLGFTKYLNNSSKPKIEEITENTKSLQKKSSGFFLPDKKRSIVNEDDPNLKDSKIRKTNLSQKSVSAAKIPVKKSSGQISQDMKLIKGPKNSGYIPSLPNKSNVPDGMVKISKKKKYPPFSRPK